MLRPNLRWPKAAMAVTGLVVGALLANTATASAVLIDPKVGPHSGNYGAHSLINDWEFPTVCKYDSQHHLKSINVRRPIVFGVDRTNHTDTQRVGWRFRIEYQDATVAGVGYADWPDAHVSNVKKADATDDDNAAFLPRVYTRGSDTLHFVYRVSYDMSWYYPNNTHKDGSAVHVAWYYKQKDPQYPDVSSGSGYCYGTAVSPP